MNEGLLQSSMSPAMGGEKSVRLTDEELMRRFRHGDQQAFETLFRRWRPRVFRIILRFLRDSHASEDATQDLFLKVVSAPERFEARSRFSTWLIRVARNLCIDYLRKQRYRRALSLDSPPVKQQNEEQELPLHERLAACEPSPEEQAESSLKRLRLLSAIARLPDEQRVVLLLREAAGLPFEEIARIMKAPLNTTKSRMRYALGNLRRLLEK